MVDYVLKRKYIQQEYLMDKENRNSINWYPGHMTKAKRGLEKHLKMIDIVVQVLDSRAPKSSMNPDFAPLFAGKRCILVLNKSDMADPSVTERWLEYYRERGFRALSYTAKRPDKRLLLSAIEAEAADIRDRYAKRGMQRTVRALVCGIPNVGKSAIINTLCGYGKLKVANKPGVTKQLSWVKVGDYIELMDSPGLLWPKITDKKTGTNIALMGSINELILPEDELSIYLIKTLQKNKPEMLLERFKLKELSEDPVEILEAICTARGYIIRGGDFDYERAEKVMLEEFRNGKIGRYSLEVPV